MIKRDNTMKRLHILILLLLTLSNFSVQAQKYYVYCSAGIYTKSGESIPIRLSMKDCSGSYDDDGTGVSVVSYLGYLQANGFLTAENAYFIGHVLLDLDKGIYYTKNIRDDAIACKSYSSNIDDVNSSIIYGISFGSPTGYKFADNKLYKGNDLIYIDYRVFKERDDTIKIVPLGIDYNDYSFELQYSYDESEWHQIKNFDNLKKCADFVIKEDSVIFPIIDDPIPVIKYSEPVIPNDQQGGQTANDSTNQLTSYNLVEARQNISLLRPPINRYVSRIAYIYFRSRVTRLGAPKNGLETSPWSRVEKLKIIDLPKVTITPENPSCPNEKGTIKFNVDISQKQNSDSCLTVFLLSKDSNGIYWWHESMDILKDNWGQEKYFTPNNSKIPYQFKGGTHYFGYRITKKDESTFTGDVHSAIIKVPVPISIDSSNLKKVNVECFGESTGSIVLNGKGGTGVLKYQWSGPNSYSNSNNNIYGLKEGDYKLTITDANSCKNSFDFKLTQNDELKPGSISLDQTICSNTKPSSFTSSQPIGGPGNYMYQWKKSSNNGINWSEIVNTADYAENTNLTETTLYKRVVTSGTCKSVESNVVKVTVNPASTANAGTPLSICQSSNPSAIALSGSSIGGGAATGTWSILTTGEGNLSSTNPSNTPSLITYTPPANKSGTVVLKLTSNALDGCTAATSERTITINPLSVGGKISESPHICSGSTMPDLTLTGYTGDSIHWQRSSNSSFSPYEDIDANTSTLEGSTVGPLTSTTYFRAVVQSGVCSSAVSEYATIIVDSPSVPGSLSKDQTICEGTEFLDLALNYYNGGVIWQSSDDNINFSDLSETGNTLPGYTLNKTSYYRAKVTNGSCPESYSNPVKIKVNPTVYANVNISTDTTTICKGTNVRFDASPTNGGANPTYQWMINSDSIVTSSSPNFETTTLNKKDVVKVIMTPKDVLCLAESSVKSNEIEINVNPLPKANVGTINEVCKGSSITIGAAAEGSNTYSWTSDPVGFTSNISNPIITPDVSMKYNLEESVKETGCKNSNSIVVDVVSIPEAAGVISSDKGYVCAGDVVTYSVPAITGATSYIWNYSGTGVTISDNSREVKVSFAANATSGKLSVCGHNFCGDGTSQSILITVLNVPSQPVIINESISPCEGREITYNVDKVSGVDYTWSFPDDWIKTSVENSNSATVKIGSSSGIITVTPSNTCGDGLKREKAINLLSISPAITNVACKGVNSGEINTAIQGGVSPYQYSWTDIDGFISSNSNLKTLKAGTYNLSVTDNSGCLKQMNSIEVKEPTASLELSLITKTDPTCYSRTDGEIKLKATGGWGGYKFSRTTIDPSPDSVFKSLSGDVKYNFSVADAMGCTSDIEVSLGQPSPLILTNSIKNLNCKGDGTGKITISANGGTSPYKYSFGRRYYSSLSDTSNIQIGHYTLSILDSKGCVTTSPVDVKEPDSLKIDISNRVGTIINCPGNRDTIWVSPYGGTTPYALIPESGPGVSYLSKGFALCNQPDGRFRFTITDANGCSKNDSAVISSIPGPKISLVSVVDASCSYSHDGSIEVLPSSHTTSVNVTWPNGYTGNTLNGVSSGSYKVFVKDANGCTHDTSIIVGAPTAVQISLLNQRDPKCFGNADGSILVNANGGTSPYNYNWSNGSQVSTTGEIPSGIYNVSVTDSKGCVSNASYVLADPPSLKPNFPSIVTICSNQSYDIDAGMPSATSYQWYSENGFSSTDRMVTLSDAGNYYLLVTDVNGCTGRGTLTLAKSSGIIDANFMIADKASVGDTLVLIEMSWPVPQAIEWSHPASFLPIYQNDYSIYLIPQVEGSYSIGLTSFVGACSEYTEKPIVIGPAKEKGNQQISKMSTIKDVMAYPNPNRGDFSIEVKLNQESDVMVEVYSVYGNRLDAKKGNGLSFYKFDINLFRTPGIYLVRISAGNEFRSLRVVVE